MASPHTKLQLPVTHETRDRLKEIAHQRRVPLNQLIVNGDLEVMGILRADLETRLRHNATRYN